MTQVTITALTKQYAGSSAPSLDQLSIDIQSGELAALLGPSGCGKTTAMKMIAGLLQPTSGDVQFDGQSIVHQKPEHRGVVMVFQNYLLFPYMSVADNIGFGLKMRKYDQKTIAHRVDAMLSLVKLQGYGNRQPSELSGGQQQRVALARALIVQPKVLLLDEPLSNLDSHLRGEMRDLIRSLQQELRITTLFVTHDQEEAMAMADHVGLILDGKLKQYARPEAFYKAPIDQETARFFGGTNFIDGVVEGDCFTSALGRLKIPAGVTGGRGTLTIRPENIVILPDKSVACDNTLAATVVKKVYLGTHTKIRLKLNQLTLEVIVNPAHVEALDENQVVSISLPISALWVLPQ